MHLGVDFDNTLVSYDELFHRCALERGLIPADLPRTKSAVRAHLWALPDGNTPWTELQGLVYGTRMAEAAFFAGAREALVLCRERGIRVSIISHKLEFPARGPRVSLRKASLEWMEAQGFFDPAAIGLAREAIFFESSREAKLARIAGERCTHFVDDLPEVLDAPGFPAAVEKWFFDPTGSAKWPAGARRFGSWAEIRSHLETMRP
ncbi:MAG TPA: haloacid dehalogenase-like hydrolase [Kiritimatiellia bacterium]|nr:haloacid dehalogenase-like hydrolase [Kiritimatiellia bacterium]HRZ11843.1 haloacid dehalogenase-like hydrolase [Kiritimatiellia bacterium]HSA17351.1 haloacid dehalogenase-like hydrolase [Kiritimatiellia bacterium]